MIIFFCGTPGSGKSYEAVKKIIDNLKIGRVVCTNVDGMDQPQAQEYIKNLCNLSDFQFKKQFIYLTPAQVSIFWKYKTVEHELIEGELTTTQDLICPPNSLIVLDEVHKYFNSRNWQASASVEVGDWASTHRHNGYDLVLITQSIDKVDKQLRTLTEWTYFFRKVNFLGGIAKNKFMKYSYTGDDHSGKALANSVNTYDPKIFPAYSSYTTKDAKEVGFMTHINILKHPIFYAIPVVICLCLYFFSNSSIATGDILGNGKTMKRYSDMRKVVAVVPPVDQKNVSFSAVPPVHALMSSSSGLPATVSTISPQVSVVGYYESEGVYHVLLSDGSRSKSKVRPSVAQKESRSLPPVAATPFEAGKEKQVSSTPRLEFNSSDCEVVNVHSGAHRGQYGGVYE